MQRLVDVADEVNEKREVARGTLLIVIPIPNTMGILIDFCPDAIPLWTMRCFVTTYDV